MNSCHMTGRSSFHMCLIATSTVFVLAFLTWEGKSLTLKLFSEGFGGTRKPGQTFHHSTIKHTLPYF